MRRKISTKVLSIALFGMLALTACDELEDELTAETQDVTFESEDIVQSIENQSAESYVGNWRLDYEKTAENLQQYSSMQDMFGTGLGSYGSDITMQEDGFFSYYIGIGEGAEGQYEVDGQTITAQVISYREEEEQILTLTVEEEEGTQYILMEYDGEVLYWVADI